MTVKLCNGCWLATGEYNGKAVTATGKTRLAALMAWCDAAAAV